MPAADAFDETIMHIAQPLRQREARHFGLAAASKTQKNTRVAWRDTTATLTPSRIERDAERAGLALGAGQAADQVITVGAVRPVRCSISAIDRDRAMRSASAACVSMSWRLASGS